MSPRTFNRWYAHGGSCGVMSVVRFKFKAEHEFTEHDLAGASLISVEQLKQVITDVKLKGNAGAFGLLLSNAATGEPYGDDASIAADTSVVIKRVPLSRAAPVGGVPLGSARRTNLSASLPCAASAAASSVSTSCGAPSTSCGAAASTSCGAAASSCSSISVAAPHIPLVPPTTNPPPEGMMPSATCIAGEAEAAKIKMMMAAAGAEWQAPRPRYYEAGGGGGGPHGDPAANRTPPPGYVCRRCNQPGHFIQFCPTNDGNVREAPQRRRLPVGIPTAFLKSVGGEGDGPAGGFLSADGTVLKMLVDDKSFNRETKKSGVRIDPTLVPEELRCPISKALFREPVVLPCCGCSVSNDLIAQALVEDASGDAVGATCALCGATGVRVDEIVPNRQLREALAAFIEDTQGEDTQGGAADGGAPEAIGAPEGGAQAFADDEIEALDTTALGQMRQQAMQQQAMQQQAMQQQAMQQQAMQQRAMQQRAMQMQAMQQAQFHGGMGCGNMGCGNMGCGGMGAMGCCGMNRGRSGCMGAEMYRGCGNMDCGNMGCGNMGCGNMGCGNMGCGNMGCGNMGCYGNMGCCGNTGCGNMSCSNNVGCGGNMCGGNMCGGAMRSGNMGCANVKNCANMSAGARACANMCATMYAGRGSTSGYGNGGRGGHRPGQCERHENACHAGSSENPACRQHGPPRDIQLGGGGDASQIQTKDTSGGGEIGSADTAEVPAGTGAQGSAGCGANGYSGGAVDDARGDDQDEEPLPPRAAAIADEAGVGDAEEEEPRKKRRTEAA